MNIPTGISADGRNILGYIYYSDDFEMSSSAPAYWLTYVISVDGSGTGVEHMASALTMPEAVYSIEGHRLDGMTKGLNIVRNSDGSVTKILRK